MIDTVVMLFCLGMVVFINARAVMLDRLLPWFPPLSKPDLNTPPPPGPARRTAPAAARPGARDPGDPRAASDKQSTVKPTVL